MAGGRLDLPVRDVMTPGVVTIPDSASLGRVYGALAAHRVHAVLVVSAKDGRAQGWATAQDLLSRLGSDPGAATAHSAIAEPPSYIDPDSPAREAVAALSEPGVDRLLVARGPEAPPEGVVSALDLVGMAAGRAG